MEDSRQKLADEGSAGKSIFYKIKSVLRHFLRVAVFSVTPLRKLVEREPASPSQNKVNWDTLLSSSRFSTYLGSTIRIDASNAMTATMVKYHASNNPKVFDLGCSGGTLALALISFAEYLGSDVSAHAIEVAKADPALAEDLKSGRVRFEVSDLRDFKLENTKWDVIVFNEVLYYLKCDQAVEQVQRYARSLTADGIICVTMKNDGKSRAIFSMLLERFDWKDGILLQQKANKPSFSIDLSRERSALLVGVFGQKQNS